MVRLALALFDQTRAIHGLTDREREWLEYAALMHDIGGLHQLCPPPSSLVLPDQERRPARVPSRGNRGHRAGGALPPPRHAAPIAPGVRRAARRRLRRTVRALASILRVAESLDRSHAQVVSGLEVRDRGTDMLRTAAHVGGCGARALGDPSLPRTVRAAGRQAGAPGDGRCHARGQGGTTNVAVQPRLVNAGRRRAARNGGAPQDLRSYRRRSPTRRPLTVFWGSTTCALLG